MMVTQSIDQTTTVQNVKPANRVGLCNVRRPSRIWAASSSRRARSLVGMGIRRSNLATRSPVCGARAMASNPTPAIAAVVRLTSPSHAGFGLTPSSTTELASTSAMASTIRLSASLLADALAFQHLVAVGVDHTALLVHHVVVLEHAFADQEVLLLDLLLRFLDLFGEHPSLDRLLVALLVHPTQFVQDAVDTVAREQAHKVVLRGQEEARLARVSLATGATAQLVVDPPGLVALGAADEQPTRGHHRSEEH